VEFPLRRHAGGGEGVRSYTMGWVRGKNVDEREKERERERKKDVAT
jgi:hypothetical protein